MKSRAFLILASIAAVSAAPLTASEGSFKKGPVFTEFGPVAPVEGALTVPSTTAFKVAFDVAAPADAGKLNRTIESAARFINMHVAAGIDEKNIDLAIVVHGGAALDLTTANFYSAKKDGAQNGNIEAIRQLQAHGVKLYLCGQSAAAHGIAKSDLLPGVEISLSAMTAHAVLQQQGYTLNPF
ncbi:DsrE family protein [Sphingopyxis sp.]|uniref:DsrE family protein n=1 Tax=Sphingopyxis sp. TaxID=1908224 RepID=UPI001DFFE781|nr:DsrE family protein [Sphingopyxis sp.]MBW8294469.1 DsrE family protein [Sphingopyxis sp.]